MESSKKIKYYTPPELSLNGIALDANQFLEEKSRAEFALGLLKGSLGKPLNPSLLISPLTTKEATVSSRIEGTQSTVSDVFLYEAGGKPQYSGTAEVANYRKAMYQAVDSLRLSKQITEHLLKSIHATLLKEVRHKGIPGNFRKGPVWIGEKEGDPIEKAIYIPPISPTVESYIENLLGYIEKGKEDPLTKAAIAHYQFEAIHPFDDGNGRIGRLLIPLILFQQDILPMPMLYLSGYFDSHRNEYLSALHEVDETNRYENWLKFFFHSTAEQLKETLDLIENIKTLYENLKNKFAHSKSPYLIYFLEFIFEHPVFNATAVLRKIGSTRPPVSNLVHLFEKEQLIVPSAAPDKRYKFFHFQALLKLLM